MSGAPGSEISGLAGHPPDLVRAEHHYLVRWGTREMIAGLLLTALGTAVLVLAAVWNSPFWIALLFPLVAAEALGILFFRNPRRRVPQEMGILVAPADGRVIEVGPVDEPEYIGGPAYRVGIFLSIFDVHVNRAPCQGRIEHLRRRQGRFLDARDARAPLENESQSIGILRDDSGGPPGLKVLVRQVAGAIARRIVCPLQVGQSVERGRLIGMIKYGSRTDLFIPASPLGPAPEVLVRVGDRVVGGESAIYRYPTAPGE